MMVKYDSEQLSELSDQFNLYEYVEQNYDVAKRIGHQCMIHCPTHKDETASLSLNRDDNSWYCFSCHKGGGPIQWFQQIEGLSFPKAAEKLQKLTGTTLKPIYTPSSLKFFKQVKSVATREKPIVHRDILPDEYYDQFEAADGEPHEWIEEGIPEEILRRYDIRLDTRSNRIVYKVFDNEDRLIGVKGRTRFNNYKILGIKKYVNYQQIGTIDYFQGMHENREEILRSKSCIVVEGLKSVMKLAAFGYNNAIAAETSVINDMQAEVLIKMGLDDITLAFDNDVSMKQILVSAKKLSQWTNVYVIYDSKKLLGEPTEKRSPCDCGLEIWERLYKERRRL